MSLSPLVTLTGIGGGDGVMTEGQVANQVVQGHAGGEGGLFQHRELW